jgi:hypothetical protein
MRRSAMLILFFAAGISAIGAQAAPVGGEPSAFDRIGTHYETIRLALLQDTTDGVAVAASHIGHELEVLGGGFSAEAAGTVDGTEQQLRGILPKIRSATNELRVAGDLEQAREAFGKLSEAMVHFRQMVRDPGPVVVFCSMAQAAWLQPKGEIGNPYYGQGMARCGEVVSE